MRITKILKPLFPVVLLLFATACVTTNTTTSISPAVQALLDKAAIEDMVLEYYSHLGTGGGRGFGDYFVEDSVLDVDGTIAKGQEEIENLYKRAGGDLPTARGGTFRMLLTNIRVIVNGDSATGEMFWIGLYSATPKAMAEIIEHGREKDEFLKRDGKWYFKNRMVTSDSGLSGIFAETYIER
jgi:hypothetical protein